MLFVLVGYHVESAGFSGKTLWDWLDLLVVPGVLVVGGYLLDRAERNRERRAADEQAQDSTLQSYLDYMGKLMTEDYLRDSDEDSEVRVVARTRTLAALEALGPRRKASLLRFLYESGLLCRERPVVRLDGAYFNHADLKRMQLSHSDFSRTVLVGADLRGASLRDSDLSRAVLSHADLSYIPRTEGDQTREDPAFEAVRHGVQPYVTPHDELTSITYIGTDLRGAALRGAVMKGVSLCDALLEDADLTDANLTDADLTGARVTDEQLAACKSLVGATMPNGSKFEQTSR